MAEMTTTEKGMDSWGWYLASGITSVLMGWFLLARPVDTIIALTVWIGFYALIVGIIGIVASLTTVGQKGSYWGWKLASGLFSVIAGVFVLNNVLFTAVITPIMFMYVIAFAIIANGIVSMLAGKADYMGNRNWTWGSLAVGAIYVILGVILLGANSFDAVSLLVKVSGWGLVIIGLLNAVFAFIIKREE